MDKMDYEEFKEFAARGVRNLLPDEYKDKELVFQVLTKHTRKYLGMFIRRGAMEPCGVVDIDMFYDHYRAGADPGTILTQMADILTVSAEDRGLNLNLNILDYKKIKDRLFIRVCNKKHLSDRFDDVPTTEIDEFLITYSIRLATPGNFQAAVLIDNNLLRHYGVSKEKLHRDAVKSSSKLFPACFDSCRDIMEKVGCGDVDLDATLIPDCIKNMLIVSDMYSKTGSAVVFYPHVLEMISAKLKGDFILFPYSEKCSLAFPARYEQSAEEYHNFVDSTYDPYNDGEVLSEKFYYFDAVSKNLSMIE